MRLSRSYQPRTLDEVVGQPAVIRRLKRLVAWPQPCCLLFEGLGGVGKSAAAKALIQDLGVCPFSGLVEYSASNLSIDEVRRLFGQTFRLRPMAGNPWHVLLVEELELIVSWHVNAALKDELGEQHMPERLIVVATSNDASGLDEALLQRFEVFPFSAGPTFAEACQERLAWIWQQEAGPGVPMPLGMEQMGWRNGSYSMRRAMTALGGALELRCGEEVAA
jgi:replication factor C small subunit